MPWEHFPHGADIGIRGIGATREEAFEQAALALTAVITDPARVEAKHAVEIAREAPDDELLLADWLNALVYEMVTENMIFGRYSVHIDGGRLAAKNAGIALGDRELACAPIRSPLGQRYLNAMRAAINCALANRQILTHLTRDAFRAVLPAAKLDLLYDVSHNTCKVEEHQVDGGRRELFVHRKGATRAFGPGHRDLPPAFRATGQPVLIGGSMGTSSWVLVGTERGMHAAFGSACHVAVRSMSRTQATKRWYGREVTDELAARGILIRSPSQRGVAEEAPGAYKDVDEVVDAADRAGLARKVARLEPLVCIKG